MLKGMAEMSYNILKKHIGEEVACYVSRWGEKVEYKGKMEEVVDFDYIVINGRIVKFVGENEAITDVIIGENILYRNNEARTYSGVKNYDLMALIVAQKELLGFSIEEAKRQKEPNIKR